MVFTLYYGNQWLIILSSFRAAYLLKMFEIIVALFCTMVIGFFWFGPIFGNLWIKHAHPGKTCEDLRKMGNSPLIYTVLTLVVMLSVLNVLMK